MYLRIANEILAQIVNIYSHNILMFLFRGLIIFKTWEGDQRRVLWCKAGPQRPENLRKGGRKEGWLV
jgi:hypothetical protein